MEKIRLRIAVCMIPALLIATVVLMLVFTLVPAWAACPVAQANDAAKEANRAYELAMEQQAQPAGPAEVVLSEPGQGVTADTGQAPAPGISDQDRQAMDALSIDREAWSPL